ncbi:MAG: Spy/CpxP family protein refolding chaperone [Alphaproteobacteria bacterium]
MNSISKRTAPAIAGAGSLLVLVLVSAGLLVGAPGPARASGSPAGGLLAQAAPAPAAPAAATPAPQTQGPLVRVEARITELHKQFQITAVQEPLFKAYADVLRSNAQTMDALFQERAKSTDTSAIGELRWYSRLTTAHGDALGKLVPVFDALYQSMSDPQKKAADKVFAQLRQRRQPREAH